MNQEELPPAAAGGVSRSQKVRLALLVCVLAGLVAAFFWVRARQRRREQERQEQITSALAELRRLLGELSPSAGPATLAAKFSEAESQWNRVKELDPENREADRLAVPLNYAGFYLLLCSSADEGPAKAAMARRLGEGSLLRAIESFNGLDAKGIAAEIGEGTYGRAARALDPYPLLQVDAGGAEIHATGADFLHRCAVLWGLARRITQDASAQKDAALLICRWLALHAMEWAQALPADPYMVVWRGYGTAPQLAWTYAELARQTGLRCNVTVVSSGEAKEYLVRVSPTGEGELVINPRLGLPVVDESTGELLSLEALMHKAVPYRALLGLAGNQAGHSSSPAFDVAEPVTALDPRACFPRFLVFNHLLSPLSEHPRVSFEGDSLPEDEQLVPWQFAVDTLDRMRGRAYLTEAQKAYRALELVHEARLLHMHGLHASAGQVYAGLLADLRKRLPDAEVAEAAAVLTEALELASFLGAANEYDGENLDKAQEGLKAYLDQYQQGRWEPLAKALLAETLDRRGDRAGAEALWRDLPSSLESYGSLRAKGLLPAVAARGHSSGAVTGGRGSVTAAPSAAPSQP